MHSSTVPVLVLAVARTNYAKGEPSSFRLAYSIYHTLSTQYEKSTASTPHPIQPDACSPPPLPMEILLHLGILFSVLAHNELREFESHTLAAMCGSIFQVYVTVEG